MTMAKGEWDRQPIATSFDYRRLVRIYRAERRIKRFRLRNNRVECRLKEVLTDQQTVHDA